MLCVLWLATTGAALPTVSGVSASLVDAYRRTEPVTGSPAAAAPGSLVAIKVTATLAQGNAWRSTSYAFGDGAATCADTADRTTSGTYTEYVQVTLPERTPTPGSVTVRLYASGGCPGEPVGSAQAAFVIRSTTANPVVEASCDTRVALVLDESGSIGSTAGAKQAVIDGSKAFVNGL